MSWWPVVTHICNCKSKEWIWWLDKNLEILFCFDTLPFPKHTSLSFRVRKFCYWFRSIFQNCVLSLLNFEMIFNIFFQQELCSVICHEISELDFWIGEVMMSEDIMSPKDSYQLGDWLDCTSIMGCCSAAAYNLGGHS